MKLVRQRHECGCVVACMAMIFNTSYAKALELANLKRNKRGKYLPPNHKATFTILAKYNSVYNVWGPKKLSELTHTSLLVINHYGSQHAMVWDSFRSKILDPYPSKSRKIKKQFPVQYYEKNLIFAIEFLNEL